MKTARATGSKRPIWSLSPSAVLKRQNTLLCAAQCSDRIAVQMHGGIRAWVNAAIVVALTTLGDVGTSLSSTSVRILAKNARPTQSFGALRSEGRPPRSPPFSSATPDGHSRIGRSSLNHQRVEPTRLVPHTPGCVYPTLTSTLLFLAIYGTASCRRPAV